MFAKKALLVDDSRSARFVLGKLLKQHDFNVEMVGSAEEALDFLKRQRPDAIFMDYQMPGMSGLEATAKIKEDPSTADIPVVMCSANEENEFLDEVEASGALGVLPKPPTKEKLDEILSSVTHSLDVHAAKVAEEARAKMPVTPLSSAEAGGTGQEAGPDQMDRLIVEVLVPLVDRRVEERLTAVAEQWDAVLEGFQAQMRQQVREVMDSATTQGEQDAALNDSLAALERRILEQTEDQMQELRGRLLVDFTSDPQVFSQLRAVAEGSAQMVASEAAAEVAHKVAINTAQEVVDAATEDQLTLFYGDIRDVKSSLQRRIYLFAGGAALAGLVAAGLAAFFGG